MKTEEILIIGYDDLVDPDNGYSWSNLKDDVSKKASYFNIVIFDGSVVKNRYGKKRIAPNDKLSRAVFASAEVPC